MNLHKILVFGSLLVALPSLAVPQEPVSTVGALEAPLQLQLLDLLSWECGSAEKARQFELAIEALAVEAGASLNPILIEVLEGGAPLEVRKAAQDGASRRFDRRQAWLAENGRELFGDEADEIADRDREGYVEDSLRRLDLLFRGNAARALGVVGGYEAIVALQAAAERQPDLELLAKSAAESIERRGANGRD